MLNEDLSASFADLLDTDYQDHVITAMKGWCDNYRYTSGEAYANLVETQISKPLKLWINETLKADNYPDIEAANTFAIKADNIIYILRYKTKPLYPEYVSLLNDAWSEFQRSTVYSLYIKARVLSKIIDNQPDLQAAVAEKLRQLEDEKFQEIEARKQANLEKWRDAGPEAARKYHAEDVGIWVKAAKKILKRDMAKIKSCRLLARKIMKETGYASAAFDTIRKEEKIIKLYKKHNAKIILGKQEPRL
ncbi:hypothetical protein [Nitrosomonas sp. sh817]|uniref:hypothetical protein n=1 Tax=Nitrosomonas sp. sh817 TaxID=3070658 RepID=UPI0027DCFD2A|nr:hypothetical protein [Nitrosomonas sp. sh817]WMJ09365.1 hypothetical protein RBH92_04015 [Nitrosomonas sp. sh817]